MNQGDGLPPVPCGPLVFVVGSNVTPLSPARSGSVQRPASSGDRPSTSWKLTMPGGHEAIGHGAAVVRESVQAELPQEQAFRLFTDGINE